MVVSNDLRCLLGYRAQGGIVLVPPGLGLATPQHRWTRAEPVAVIWALPTPAAHSAPRLWALTTPPPPGSRDCSCRVCL